MSTRPRGTTSPQPRPDRDRHHPRARSASTRRRTTSAAFCCPACRFRTAAAPLTLAVTATVVLLGVGITSGQANWQVYLVVMLLGGAGVARLHLRVGLSDATIWGLVLFGIGHVAGGMVPVGDGILYQVWLIDDLVRYDNLQHAVGFGFVGRATWEALRHRLRPDEADVHIVAFWVVVLGATGWGAANEIVEYVLTLTLESTNVGGYHNTARDLVANLTGGLLLGWITARTAGREYRTRTRRWNDRGNDRNVTG